MARTVLFVESSINCLDINPVHSPHLPPRLMKATYFSWLYCPDIAAFGFVFLNPQNHTINEWAAPTEVKDHVLLVHEAYLIEVFDFSPPIFLYFSCEFVSALITKLVIVLLTLLKFHCFGWKINNSYSKESNQEQIHCGWKNHGIKEQKRGITKD